MDQQTTGARERSPLVPPLDMELEQSRRASGYWWLYALAGLVSVGLGAVTLSSQISAVSTLAVLFGIFLLYGGALEIVVGSTSRHVRWLAIAAGAASAAAGIIALAWPGITLFVLAMFVGWGLMVWGIYDIYLALTDAVVKPRAVLLVRGIILTAIGVLALARPNVTIVVLAVMVGVFFIVYGVFSFVAGLRLLDLHRVLKHSEQAVPEETRHIKAA